MLSYLLPVNYRKTSNIHNHQKHHTRGQAGQLPTKYLLEVFFRKTIMRLDSWKSPIMGELWGKTEIMSTRISSVKNLQLSVGKLRVPALNPF